MPRRTVWISDELEQLATEQLPDVNWSAALQAGIRLLLECEHDELACTGCGTTATRASIIGPALSRLYSSIMFELGLNVAKPGYQGAAAIVRRVAVDQAVPGLATVPVPRATRANHEARADVAHAELLELPREADSRRRHPTSRPAPAGEQATTPATRRTA